MGCECCQNHAPEDFQLCKIVQREPFNRVYFAPCGTKFISNISSVRGSNYTPPKRHKKRNKH